MPGGGRLIRLPRHTHSRDGAWDSGAAPTPAPWPCRPASAAPNGHRHGRVSPRNRRVFCTQNAAPQASRLKGTGAACRPPRGGSAPLGHLCPHPPPQPWEACWPAPMGSQTGGRPRDPSAGGKRALLPGLESSWRGSHGLGWGQGRGEGVRADTRNPQSSPARASARRGAAHVASPAFPGAPTCLRISPRIPGSRAPSQGTGLNQGEWGL